MANTPEALYLDLLKKCLTRDVFPESLRVVTPVRGGLQRFLFALLVKLLDRYDLTLAHRVAYNPDLREVGADWPAEAETMIGLQRLDNLQYCVTDVLHKHVPGDLIETGVWRGGATIFMRAPLKVYGDNERIVWLADSFQGLPKPSPQLYGMDAGDRHWRQTFLAVSVEEVKQNFVRYGLLDEQVRFLVGWFSDTLPQAPIDQLGVLRLDGDMYESTMDALRYLYPKLSIGGYTIVDDYGAVPGCKAAIEDFRAEHGITEELKQIDWSGVFWQRLR